MIRQLVCLAVVAAYPIASFYPYEWKPPSGVMPTMSSEGGIEFPLSGIAQTRTSPQWMPAAIDAQQLDVTLAIRPALHKQWGPARIFTISRSPYERNLTIGQEENDIIVRLRTPLTDANGQPEIRVSDVVEPMRWMEVRVSIQSQRALIAVDGWTALEQPLPPDALRIWNSSYPLALGNEITGGRPWRGQIRHAVVRTGDVVVDYAARGALEIPGWVWHFRLGPRAFEPPAFKIRDVAKGVVGFVPFGVAVASGLCRNGTYSLRFSLLLVALASILLEALQLGFPNAVGEYRFPLARDMILNTVGGGVGVVLIRWVARRTKPRIGRPTGSM